MDNDSKNAFFVSCFAGFATYFTYGKIDPITSVGLLAIAVGAFFGIFIPSRKITLPICLMGAAIIVASMLSTMGIIQSPF